MAVIREPASKRLLTGNMAVDVLAASPQLRQFEIVLQATSALCVQNTSTYLSVSSARTSGFKVVDAWVNFVTIPVMSTGTSTLGIGAIDTDGTTATVIVTAADVLSGYTAKVPVQQTLAATNPTAITAGQSILVTVTTSDATVDTADVGASVTLLCEAIEDTTISDSTTSTANT